MLSLTRGSGFMRRSAGPTAVLLVGLAVGAGLSQAVQSTPAWAAVLIRHFLPDLAFVTAHGGPLEGEIAARPQEDLAGPKGYEYLQGGQFVGVLGGDQHSFPSVRTFAYSRFSASDQTVTIDPGSIFEFDNGERIRLTDSSPNTYQFTLSSIDPPGSEWTYLYVKKSGGPLSVVATSVFGLLNEANVGVGDFAYLGAVWVDMVPVESIRPIRRIGTRYFYRDIVPVETVEPEFVFSSPNAITIMSPAGPRYVPVTAVKAYVWGMNTGTVAPYLWNFCHRFGGPIEGCVTGLFEANKGEDGKIKTYVSAFGSTEQGPITVQIQGFEEGLVTLR
ncbi:MAG: hypothetical protein IT285_12075 [Bdellovibrionales bacterium]|nr:hypothetical protein [Bdellovibrionales bacterium]